MPAYTVCFCGTACSRDEGEEDRKWDYKLIDKDHVVSDKRIYDRDTGYIPVRIHLDISKNLKGTKSSVTVRGVGENDWADQNNESDALSGTLSISPPELHKYVAPYLNGSNQRTLISQGHGWGASALAFHGAKLASDAARGGATVFNFLGHSRGAVSAIMAAWFLRDYGGLFGQIPINIFAIDPVPGPGDWYGILTQLPPNVSSYVGVYAWDHLDSGFDVLVPRPNFQMTGNLEHLKIETRRKKGSSWQTLADKSQLDDPLAPNKKNLKQPENYHLYACRGRHGTVAGNITSDGTYEASKVSKNVASVPRLVYKLARAYLTLWGTVFQTRCRVAEDARTLRRRIHSVHGEFDAMAGGEARTSRLSGRRYVRRVSSIPGRLGTDKYYLEDVVGDPPYKLAYPCTAERGGGGWVNWKFL
jgi:hypothetical protein